MAQNITIAGASFTDVPAIDVPKTGGGTARYIDPAEINAELLVSLDSDFVAGNIKKDVDLFGLVGTLEGGGGGINLPDAITNFAVDTFTVASNRQSIWINHSLGAVPCIAIIVRAGDVYTSSTATYPYVLPTAVVYGQVMLSCIASSTQAFNGTNTYSASSLSYSKRNTQNSMTSTRFYVSMNGSTDLRAGDYVVITMKW